MPMQTAAGPPAGHPPRAPNPAPATVIAPAWGEMPTTGFWRLGSSDGLGSALKCDRISLALRRAPQSHPQNIRVWTDRPPRFGFGPDVRVDMSNTGRAISSSNSRRNRAAAFSAADVPRGQAGLRRGVGRRDRRLRVKPATRFGGAFVETLFPGGATRDRFSADVVRRAEFRLHTLLTNGATAARPPHSRRRVVDGFLWAGICEQGDLVFSALGSCDAHQRLEPYGAAPNLP
jgi:hypothetical protein